MQHCLALGASGAQAVGGIHLGLSTLYHSAQFAKPGVLLHTFMYISQSPPPLSYSNNVSRHLKTMWLLLEQSLGRQKPQAKVLFTWWCQLCCICSSQLGHIWGHTSLHFRLWPRAILVQGATTEATGEQKVHYGRFFNGTRTKKTRATAFKETCGKSWSPLSNEFVFVDGFFFLASNKMSAQLKLFLSLGWYQKVRELCGFLSLMEEVCCCDLAQWGVFS